MYPSCSEVRGHCQTDSALTCESVWVSIQSERITAVCHFSQPQPSSLIFCRPCVFTSPKFIQIFYTLRPHMHLWCKEWICCISITSVQLILCNIAFLLCIYSKSNPLWNWVILHFLYSLVYTVYIASKVLIKSFLILSYLIVSHPFLAHWCAVKVLLHLKKMTL